MYKAVTIYVAPMKKNKTYNIKKSDFKDTKEMNKYIAGLRAKHKEENKVYREEMKKKKYAAILDKAPDQSYSRESSPPKKDISISIQEGVDLQLDQGTGNSTCLLGSSKQGKSTLLMYLYKKYYSGNDFISTLFSPNIHAGVYEKDKNLLTCNTFNKKGEKYIRLQKYINSKTNNLYNYMNAFDDCINKMQYKSLLNELILSFRNSNLSTIISFQYLRLLSKMNRANCNNIIVFASNSGESVDDLIATFLRPYFVRMGYTTYEEQLNLYNYVTSNHGFFYINNAKGHISYHRLKL